MTDNEYRTSLDLWNKIKVCYDGFQKQLSEENFPPEEELIVFLLDLRKSWPLMFAVEQRCDFRQMKRQICSLIDGHYRGGKKPVEGGAFGVKGSFEDILDYKAHENIPCLTLTGLEALADEVDFFENGNGEILLKRPFVARFNLPSRKPFVRAYLHRAGLLSAYGQKDTPVDCAKSYMTEVIESTDLQRYAWVLAAIWGNSSGERCIDFFGYGGISDWTGNPDVSAFVVKNGIIIPQKEITCGDTLIVLGKEESFRRTTQNLEEYASKWPFLGELEPLRTRNC